MVKKREIIEKRVKKDEHNMQCFISNKILHLRRDALIGDIHIH